MLSTVPIPEIEDIEKNKEFKPKYMSEAEFTRMWNAEVRK
ncbi:DUF6881 domain-containing protein [Halobacillus litoralis]